MRTLLHSPRLKRFSCAFLAFCFVCLIFNAQGQTGYAANSGKKKGLFGMFSQDEQQNQPANSKNTLFNVLKDLNKQKGVYFLFSDPSLGSKPVNAVTNSNVDIEKILDQVLKKYRAQIQEGFRKCLRDPSAQRKKTELWRTGGRCLQTNATAKSYAEIT